MPMVQTDWTISQAKDIRYTGAAHGASGASYATVIEFHRWLQAYADDAVAVASTNDFLDITDPTPSERQTDNIIQLINGYNIDQTASEHLYDGSIIQASGADIWDGLVVIAAPGMDLQIIQNGAVIAGDFWNSLPFGASFLGLNSDSANGYSHRFMLKVRTGGNDIDGRRIIGITRVWGKSYSEFKVNGTARGNNVLALTYADDLNNATSIGSLTGSPFTSVTNVTAGYNGIDVDNNAVDEFYYSEWNRGSASINQFYERIKYITRSGETTTLYGIPGEMFRGITHEVNLTTPRSGTFSAVEAVSWGSGATAGTGQMLAINSTTAGTKMWIQLLTGVAPSASVTITGGTSSATATNSGSPVERTVSPVVCGVSTGSAIIGAFGFGIEAADLLASDKVFDLTNTQITPPNNQTFTVSGLVVGEDYVLVGPESGGTLNSAQFSLNTTLSAANVTSVVISTTIPSDTPAAGTIRVEDDVGIFRRLVYTSWTGSTFTIDPTASEAYVANVADFNVTNATAGNDVYISYIDELATTTSESYSAVYSTNRALFVRVRDGAGTPIKTFETTATFGSGGGSATVIRTSDT